MMTMMMTLMMDNNNKYKSRDNNAKFHSLKMDNIKKNMLIQKQNL
jgi:hypothetical protein